MIVRALCDWLDEASDSCKRFQSVSEPVEPVVFHSYYGSVNCSRFDSEKNDMLALD